MIPPLISVIVPVYKVEDYLDECISSIVRQSYSNLEIILVDDGSPDSCPQMCDKWVEQDSRIKVIHQSNGGLSAARNAGLDIASGAYIAFIDSDDYIQLDMLEKLYEAIVREDADIAACGITTCVEDGQTAWGCMDYTGSPEGIFKLLFDDTKFPVSTLNKLYCRHCWKTLRFPVGKTCEDAFTTYQLIHNAKRIVMIPEALYCYRIRPNSIMTSAFSLKKMDEEEAWRCNYLFMEQNYPTLRKAAYDFYLQKVNILLHIMTTDDRSAYPEQFSYLRGILKKNLLYVLLNCGLQWKQRIKLALDIITS